MTQPELLVIHLMVGHRTHIDSLNVEVIIADSCRCLVEFMSFEPVSDLLTPLFLQVTYLYASRDGLAVTNHLNFPKI